MSASFIHLNLHTDYSIVDGIVRIKPLIEKALEYQMPALAITDQSNIFAMVQFYKACLSAGIKPVLGADLWLQDDSDPEPYKLIAFCKNNQAYLNLKTLISLSYLQGQNLNNARGRAIITQQWLEKHHQGLIILLGKESLSGRFLLADDEQNALLYLNKMSALFKDNLYLEIQRTGRADDEKYLHLAVSTAAKLNLPLVATNAVRFLDKDDYIAHETRVCVNQGRILSDNSRPRHYSEQQNFCSAEDMFDLFSDIPEALANTIEISKRCNVDVELGKNYLPDFPVPQGLTMDEYFRQLSHQGLDNRLESLLDKNAEDFQQKITTYKERLDIELDVIIQMGFPGYFLIVADFIRWAKENGVPVGPGRGSGAGSLVAYALTITDLDPLAYDLLFERFLNPERVSMPDFDIDFCMEGRDKVIDYVAETYGRDKVSQIITYGKMAAKAAIRDVGRVQALGYGFVDSVAKLIPLDLGITLSRALDQEEELRKRYDDEEDVRDLYDMALKLEGVIRNVGKHAGGVVISPSDINNFAPVYCEPDGTNLVTQFDKNDVEDVGLVKFDFLGLKTLTVIDWALKIINDQKKMLNQEAIDITSIDIEDRKAFATLKASDTTAVFQLESRGMKELITKLQPDCFEDIVALVALYRPGPLGSGMVDDFIERKHGRQKVEYPHPSLETILKPTYGTILYQEQVMQISQVLAGYSLGGADLLRRAMGKKKADVMAQQRSIFEEGAVNNNIDKELATHIFDQMEEFAKYGFNKSHSAAYALVSYQTLWLKTYYRSPFMAAVLSADMDSTDKVVGVIEECRDAGIEVSVPDVNISFYRFTVTMDQVIVYGLGAIKGVGEGAIQSIVEERKSSPYKNLQDFCNRVDLRKVNKRVLEKLIYSGAMDKLGENRATMYNAIAEVMKVAEQKAANNAMGQVDLFGDDLFNMEQSDNHPAIFSLREEWPAEEKLKYEKETLGFYLSAHPIDGYLDELKKIITHRIKELNPETPHFMVICGLLIALRIRIMKNGKKMAILILDDRSGRLEVTLFEEEYLKYKELLIMDSIIVISGEISINQYNGRVRIPIRNLYDLEGARSYFAKFLQLSIDKSSISTHFTENFKQLLIPFKDNNACEIVLYYQNEQAQCKILLSDEWRIKLNAGLLEKLKEHFSTIKIVY